MKKLFSFFIVLIMLFSILGVTASAKVKDTVKPIIYSDILVEDSPGLYSWEIIKDPVGTKPTLTKDICKKFFKARDNIDGDITSRIYQSGKIDSFKTGIYWLWYSVTDKAGDKTKAKFKITVVKYDPFATCVKQAEVKKTVTLCYVDKDLLKKKLNIKKVKLVLSSVNTAILSVSKSNFAADGKVSAYCRKIGTYGLKLTVTNLATKKVRTYTEKIQFDTIRKLS